MKNFDSIVGKIEEVVSVFSFSAMSIITIVAVFFRYVLKNPIIWSEEASRYFMVWGILIGVSMATRKASHLGVDVFVSNAPEKIRKILTIVANIVLIITFVMLTILAVQFLIKAKNLGNVSPILRIPFWMLYLSMPLGFGLSSIRGVQALIDILKGKLEPNEEVMI